MIEPEKKPAAADYAVGYRRPPVPTRFRKGESGNPRGRPARGRTMPEAIRQALHSMVVVTENGERKRAPRIDVIARQVTNKAAAGDLGAIRLIAQFCTEAKEAVGSTIQLIVSEDDMKL
jgi:hypothetical protein